RRGGVPKNAAPFDGPATATALIGLLSGLLVLGRQLLHARHHVSINGVAVDITVVASASPDTAVHVERGGERGGLHGLNVPVREENAHRAQVPGEAIGPVAGAVPPVRAVVVPGGTLQLGDNDLFRRLLHIGQAYGYQPRTESAAAVAAEVRVVGV